MSGMSVIAQNELNQLDRVETAAGRVATSPPPLKPGVWTKGEETI